MCMVSMVAEAGAKQWEHLGPSLGLGVDFQARADIAELRREVESLKGLLKAAKLYDEETGQPDCAKDEKVDLLKRLAEAVGVDLSEVLTAP